jgi:hypothetical protein
MTDELDHYRREIKGQMNIMPQSGERKHFIVKHGLDAFQQMPGFIWRTGEGPQYTPHRFDQVKLGSRWISFAYATSDKHERSLSLITGFYECTKTAWYGRIPPAGVLIADGETKAWMIEGRPCGRRLRQPVGVQPIDELLGRKHFKQETLVPITAEEFDHIRTYTVDHQFDTRKIPLIGREPVCEQELLAAVVFGHRKLGIQEIIRVRKAFPDLLVKIEGHSQEVHLELEVYSEGFFTHCHDEQVRNRRFKPDGKPVAVLCWIDNDFRVAKRVHRVYELRSLIRDGKKIRW